MALPACGNDEHGSDWNPRNGAKEITELPASAEFYLADWQNSPVVLVDAKGHVVSRTAYHPYGSIRSTAGQTDPWSFVGNEKDEGTGLGDFHARPYRVELGSFLAPDPVGVFGVETTVGDAARLFAYAYAGGNPIDAGDPSGLSLSDYLRGIVHEGVAQAKAAVSAVASEVHASVQAASEGRVLEGFGRASYLYQSTVGPIGAYHAARGLVKSVSTFGDDFANAACSDGTDYDAGRKALKPVTTAMSAVAAGLGASSAGTRLMRGLRSGSAGRLPNGALVCRGGTCTAENFAKGSGVTVGADGKLNGISTQSKAGTSIAELSKPFKNNQVGVTTVGDIRNAGGKVIADGTPGNPNHATVSGITAAQAEQLFTPTQPNPVPKPERGL